jgi:BirA family biotin operon repressor/biotin-[acetyl-CoA-carboxylase] ligase
MQSFEQAIRALNWGAMRYYESIGSTNDEAGRWLDQGAPDLAVVVANEQTRGRGRLERRWYTPADASLAFSVILKVGHSARVLTRLTALGALAVCLQVDKRYRLEAQIKWPNDVLVGGKKIAGVLTELHWLGENPLGAITGIGINIARNAIPPETALAFPATCLEDCLATPPGGISPQERVELLHAILVEIRDWRARLDSEDFYHAWESRLAFRGRWVQVFQDYGAPHPASRTQVVTGRLAGITPEGVLCLVGEDGAIQLVENGDTSLRPVEHEPGRDSILGERYA